MQAVFSESVSLPPNPIFIVGYPRSGTTLLQSLLATQPGLVSFPETHFFRAVLPKLTADAKGCLTEPLDGALEVLKTRLDLEFSPEIVARLTDGSRTPKAFFELIVWQFVKDRSGSFRWIEKTPNHVYHMPQILDWYPDALFLHIVRHPIPAIYSRRTKFTEFAARTQQTIPPLAVLAREWNEALAAYEHFRDRFPTRVYTLRYEDLAERPGAVMAEVCAFLGFKLDAARLQNYREASRKIIQPWETWKSDVKRLPIANTNDQYRVPLTHRIRIESITAAKMAAYGYPPSHSRWLERLYYRALAALAWGARLPGIGAWREMIERQRQKLLLEVD